MRDEYIKENS